MWREIIQNGAVPSPLLPRPARRPFWLHAACAVLLGLGSATGRAQDGAAQAQTGAAAQAVLRTAAGILSYTRWPQKAQPVEQELRLCVVGETAYAGALLAVSGQKLGQRRLRVARVALDDVAALQSCAGLYVGQMALDAWRALLQQLDGQALLTISEQPGLCRVGAMFCLHRPDAQETAAGESSGIGFEVNLDSVTRSGLRVNPRVLQLARKKPAGAS